jgi:hypothetical protein
MEANAVDGPRKLSVKADDSNELEADENCRPRPRTAMGYRPSTPPVEVKDSNRLEAK